MKVTPTAIPDARGFFYESFNQKAFNKATDLNFLQDNHSRSVKGVLRGLHYQIQQLQGKLVRGSVFDVAVDIRKSSPTFGKWVGIELSEDNHKQICVPPGFSHGFVVLSESADFLYKTTDYYAAEHGRCIHWNNPDLAVRCPLQGDTPMLSAKDALGESFVEAEVFEW